jgi:hypothetical protein
VRHHNRSDDFAASTELQAVSALSSELASRVHSLESDRPVHAGLSSVDRMRVWLRSKTRPRDRRAETAVLTKAPGAEMTAGRMS